MIAYLSDDLFASDAQVLVNAVNTVGVMGKGIALEFKQRYPQMFKEYQLLCKKGDLQIGQLVLHKSSAKWVLNFPTKVHWRDAAKLDDVEAGLRTFTTMFEASGIVSIAFPQLGCGAGKLDWETQVRPLMEQYLAPLPIDIRIHLYEPSA